KKLRFYFDFLDNSDPELSNDAFKEYAIADYQDLVKVYRDLPAERVVGWLRNPETSSFRFGSYGSMLGHCGKKEDAGVLRALLENTDRPVTMGVDGILAGYVLLNPAEGWTYVRGILADGKKEFMLRYAALRTARFFWQYRPDVIKPSQLA